MSVAISEVANTDTWGVLVARVNQMTDLFSSQVITTDATPSGNVTVGNGFVSGIFGATQMTTNQIRGGNVSSWSNLTLVSNLTIAANSSVNVLGGFNIGTLTANVINAQSLSVTNFNVGGVALNGNIGLQSILISTTGTAQQTVDTWAPNQNQMAKYIVTILDNTANTVESRELTVLQVSATSGIISEYSVISSNASANSLGIFDVSVNSSTVSLLFTPTSTSTAFKAVKILV